MGIHRLDFRLADHESPLTRPAFAIVIDGSEYVTSCFLLDDLGHLLSRFTELAAPGRRFDLFFSNSGPYSLSVQYRDGTHYLRISDSFDGTVLEEAVGFGELRRALVAFMDEILQRANEEAKAQELLLGLERFRAWPGPR